MNFSVEDNLYFLLKSYKKLPDFIKAGIVLPFKFLPRKYYLGKKYREFYSEAKMLEFASDEFIEDYQWTRIKNLLRHAYESVPYYKKTWDDAGIDINKIKNFEDFKSEIPFVTKGDVQKNPNDFISSKFSKSSYLKSNTGGSTGKPLKLVQLKGYSRAAEWAHMHLQWGRVGFQPSDRLARIRGDFIGKNRLYSFDPWRNMLILSSFEINNNTAEKILTLLKKKKVKYINAYPSSIYNLIQSSGLSKIELPALKGIFLGSENMLEFQISRIELFFGVRVFYWYGNGELTALGGMCEVSNNYHFFPSYGYTEFIKDNSIGKPEDDETVEIVGTSFINPLMPLIRYRTEDYGFENKNKCVCGRNHKLLSNIIGREQEIAVGLNNERISLTALVFGRHNEYFDKVVKMQILNTSPGNLIVRIIPKNNFSPKDQREIEKTLSMQEGMPFITKIEIVRNIPTTSRGKHRFLIRDFELKY